MSTSTLARIDYGAMTPEEGYSLVADVYNEWHWFRFWKENEAPFVEEWLNGLPSGIVLDAGCGTSSYSGAVRSAGHEYLGLDISREMLQAGRRESGSMAGSNATALALADVRHLPIRSSAVDYVLCTRVLNHLPELASVCREVARVTRLGGQILISDVHPDHRYNHMTIPVEGRPVSITKYKHSMSELRRIIDRAAGLSCRGIKNIGFNQLRWKPPVAGFGNLYRNPGHNVLFICTLEKCK